MAREAGKRLLLACWGNGDLGRLGLGARCSSEEIPTVVQALAEVNVTAVSCGAAHTAAIGDDGSVYTMGLNDAGQLGHSCDSASVNEPREMLLPEATTKVAAGSRHTLMLAESGDVWAVGCNSRGQLGLGTQAAAMSHWPHRIPALAGADVVHIAAGAEHCLAVTRSGDVLSWGAGSHGQLGHGKDAVPLDRDEATPRLISSLRDSTILQAAAGFLHSGCLDARGCLWVFGDNRFWQLGIPTSPQASEPAQVDLRGIQDLALSGHHSMALRHTGELFSWGANEHGVLGLGKESRASARLPSAVPKFSFTDVACGWKHCSALSSNGKLFCWGWGGSEGTSSALAPLKSSGGQLGLGNEFDFWSPTAVEQLQLGKKILRCSAGEWKAAHVACGLNHTAAVVETF